MIDRWLAALEARHLVNLTFSEAARALRALSSTYVERRERLARKSAFDTAGKRAAYALYYSPLHLLTVDRIVTELRLTDHPVRHLLDLGCGAGAAGAAWARRMPSPPAVSAVDLHPWAVTEAAFTYRALGLQADVRRGDAARVVIPKSVDAIVAGWMLNELSDADRDSLKTAFADAVRRRVRVLVVEPISTRVTPWWRTWVDAFAPSGARADEWRFRVELPDVVKRFDRAAGLRHDELTARSLLLE